MQHEHLIATLCLYQQPDNHHFMWHRYIFLILLSALLNTGLGWLWYSPALFHRFWFLNHDSSWADIVHKGSMPWAYLFILWVMVGFVFTCLNMLLSIADSWQRIILALGCGLMVALPMGLWPIILDGMAFGGWWIETVYWSLGLLVIALVFAFGQNYRK